MFEESPAFLPGHRTGAGRARRLSLRIRRLADRWHTLIDFIHPDFKALQSIWAEGGGDGNIGRVAASRYEHSSNPGHVVTWIECVPGTAKIDFNPSRKIHHPVRRERSHVAKVSGAVPRRNIHAAAERDSQVGVVATDADTLVEGFPGCSRGTRFLIIENDMAVDKIADGLHARPSRRRLTESRPRRIGEQISLAIAAAQKDDQSIFLQIL